DITSYGLTSVIETRPLPLPHLDRRFRREVRRARLTGLCQYDPKRVPIEFIDAPTDLLTAHGTPREQIDSFRILIRVQAVSAEVEGPSIGDRGIWHVLIFMICKINTLIK